ncbi:MAG: carboxylating nicotinate-nucleotide diphosphorylase [Dehalococcoidia bacterium]
MVEPPDAEVVRRVVAGALAEDRVAEDVTTLATVQPGLRGRAAFIAREAGVLGGEAVLREVFAQIGAGVVLSMRVHDGEAFAADSVLGTAEGPVRALLQGERVALNFLQRLSGVATSTRAFVDAAAGTGTTILDTRKTTPGLRDFEKYAVRCGGGTNHRRDLAAMAMIKDNHREALAREGLTLSDGVAAIRARSPGIEVEVEIDSLAELAAALAAKPEWILLDNMSRKEVSDAVHIVAGRAKLEASGGITLATVEAMAKTGVTAISVGALTHSARALDISLDLEF